MPRKQPSWDLIKSYIADGRIIIGIDEVGRGAWAGPVVAAAVILSPHHQLEGLADSKLLTAIMRSHQNRQIRQHSLAVGIGWVAPSEVDEKGLSWAVRESGMRALAELGQPEPSNLVILDGKHNYLQDTEHNSVALVKADADVVPVAAASVIAKVARDRYMMALSRRLPGYGFEFHKGYGTAVHQQALAKLGACVAHRRSYAPLRRLTDAE